MTGDHASADAGGRSDDYSAAAEFYDLVAARQAAVSGPALAAALTGLDPAAGPVVEIGAGTGRITSVIAHAVPDVRIVVAEPSAPMRAVVTSRVAADPALRRRVTVTDGAAPDLPLPETISAAVVFGVAGHLPPAARRRLWSRLRQRLAPDGLIAVELMGTEPRELPTTRWLRDTVGRQTYEWWVASSVTAPDRVRFRTTWRVLRDGRTVRTVGNDYDWYALDAARLADELDTAAPTAGAGPIWIFQHGVLRPADAGPAETHDPLRKPLIYGAFRA